MRKMKKLLILPITTALFLGSSLSASAAELNDIFDAKYYAERYSDLSAAFGDDEKALYKHYTTYGMKEGRICSPKFDVKSYRSRYSDLEKAFGDDWEAYARHYVALGIAEGRDGGGEFDAVSYANRYADLKQAYGYDLEKLYTHYQVFGIKEGRNGISQFLLEERNAKEREEENAAGESAGDSGAGEAIRVYPEDVYDANNQLVKTEFYTSDGTLVFYVTYTYDEAGNMLKSTEYDADGNVTFERTYDASGKEKTRKVYMIDDTGEFTGYYISEVDSRGLETIICDYDRNDTLLSMQKNIYDDSGRKTEVILYDGGSGKMTYKEVYNEDGTQIVYEYHENGQISSETHCVEVEEGYMAPTKEINYDEAGNITSEIHYNEDGTIKSETEYE